MVNERRRSESRNNDHHLHHHHHHHPHHQHSHHQEHHLHVHPHHEVTLGEGLYRSNSSEFITQVRPFSSVITASNRLGKFVGPFAGSFTHRVTRDTVTPRARCGETLHFDNGQFKLDTCSSVREVLQCWPNLQKGPWRWVTLVPVTTASPSASSTCLLTRVEYKQVFCSFTCLIH